MTRVSSVSMSPIKISIWNKQSHLSAKHLIANDEARGRLNRAALTLRRRSHGCNTAKMRARNGRQNRHGSDRGRSCCKVPGQLGNPRNHEVVLRPTRREGELRRLAALARAVSCMGATTNWGRCGKQQRRAIAHTKADGRARWRIAQLLFAALSLALIWAERAETR